MNETEKIRHLKQLTDRSVRVHSSRTAFLSMRSKTEFDTMTYGEFGRQLTALGNALIDKGYMGKRIALIGENSQLWVLCYLAIANIGAVVVPLDKELTRQEVSELTARAGVAAIIHSAKFAEEADFAKQRSSGLKTVCMGERGGADASLMGWISDGVTLMGSGIDRYSNVQIDENQMSTILFTSGTTGQPKGVMLSHKNIVSNVLAAAQLVLFTSSDVLLSVLPMSHAYEFVCGILGPIYDGSAIAFCPSVKKLPDALKLFRPTLMALVPLYVETFVKRIWEAARRQGKEKKLKTGVRLGNLLAALGFDVRDKLLHDVREFFGGRLKLVVCGGAYLNPELVGEFAGFGVTLVQGYGITECSPMVSANRNRLINPKSVGLLAPCNEVRIDPDGQILVRGDNVMLGYLDDPEATAQAMDGPWFKTGDIGRMDKRGFLYVTGRSKNLIVLKSGKNVVPNEIEYHLAKSPLIAEAMVKATGENGADGILAVIYPDPEATRGMMHRELSDAIQAVVNDMNARLSHYKRVHQFVLRESEFPKTTTKKIQRYKVADKDEHV